MSKSEEVIVISNRDCDRDRSSSQLCITIDTATAAVTTNISLPIAKILSRDSHSYGIRHSHCHSIGNDKSTGSITVRIIVVIVLLMLVVMVLCNHDRNRQEICDGQGGKHDGRHTVIILDVMMILLAQLAMASATATKTAIPIRWKPYICRCPHNWIFKLILRSHFECVCACTCVGCVHAMVVRFSTSAQEARC